jgi:Tol biopolymer transport system component
MSVFILLFLAAGPLFSQYNWIPYYGKNKVMEQKFKWRVIETDHFKIHYYVSNPSLIKRIMDAAELAYEKMSKLLNIQPEKKVPIIFYKSHIDFEQTNVYPNFLPPGAVAFADAFTKRVVIQGDLPGGDLMRTLTHELGHVFEYTILGKAAIFRPAPLWVYEGFSDYITGHWRSFDMLIERDSVLYDLIPRMMPNGRLVYPVNHGRAPYNWGHFLYEFIEHKFGPRGVRQLLYSYRGGAIGSKRKSFLRAYDYTPKLFNYEFRKYMRDKFKKFATRENPEDYSFSIGPDFPYAYSFSHQLSPSGEVLAILTGNMKLGKVDIILISMKDGKTIKNITPGFTNKYDNINFKWDPAGGLSMTWDKKGEKIAFFGRKALDYFLVTIDAITGKTLKKIHLKNIEDPSSPVFHPDNKKLYFTGIDNSRYCLYSIDMETEEVKKLTSGRLTIKSFAISPDGKRIVLSVFHEKYHKLYLAPLASPEVAIRMTDGEYNDIAPIFSIDGKTVYYSSDELESHNLCAIDLENKLMYRYTDVRTGNFFPTEIPGEKKQLVFSSFYRTRFQLFKKDISDYLEKREIEFGGISKVMEYSEQVSLETGEPDKIDLAEKKIEGKLQEGKLNLTEALGSQKRNLPGLSYKYKDTGKYKPFKNLFLSSYTPVTGAIGSDGSLMGMTNLSFSDLMNDHQLQFSAFSYFGYRSYNLTYMNMASRLQFYTSLYYFTDALWLSYNEYLKIRQRLGGSAGFHYPFNRNYRAELGAHFYYQEEQYDDVFYGAKYPYAQFFDGPVARLSVALVGDTIWFNPYYGPNRGHTFKVSVDKAIKFGANFMDAVNFGADFKKYIRINNDSLLAFRISGYFSKGKNPQLYWFGGDNSLRASYFRSLVGNNAIFFNAELRFPLIYTSNTILGAIGGIRGVLFFDIGGVWMDDDPEGKFRFFADGRGLENLFKQGSMKLKDGLSSYGFGIVLYMFGYPLHFDWVYQTDLHARKYYGVNFWMGFDF